MQLSEKLKYYRKKLGLRQQDIAGLLNLERSTYSYYETGKTTPTLDTLVKLAAIFNISIDTLVESESSGTLKVAEAQAEYDNSHSMNLNTTEKSTIIKMRGLDEESLKKVMELIDKCLDSLD